MKGTHKFVIGSLVLATSTLPPGAAGEKIDYEALSKIKQRDSRPRAHR